MENYVKNSGRHYLDRPITGVIQEDRIWEQWYDQDVFKKELPKMTQREYLFKNIGNDLDRVIINNRGMKEITGLEFYKMTEKYIAAFASINLNKGDIIATIGLTTPEMIAIKYAATELGLITCNLNVLDMGITDDGKNRLYRQLENINPRMIFTLDYLEDKVSPVINDEKFKNALKVTMPLANSTPITNPEKYALALNSIKNFLTGKNVKGSISLASFLSLGKEVDMHDVDYIYEPGLPCNISFTSGTTGINKAVLLSHDANNALAFQQQNGGFGFYEGTRNLALIPPFLAFWDADVIHAVLAQGGCDALELDIAYDKIPKYLKKHIGTNMGIWPQYMWNSLLELPDEEVKKICDNLEFAIVGGERCEINAFLDFYEKTGIKQMTGYGASELNTTFTLTHPNCFKPGSAGIPMPFNNVKIVNERFEDVTYNVPGRVLLTGPCLMNGYYNNDELTKKAIYVDEKGRRWFDTGDYGVMDEDGCLTVLDRYKAPVEINTSNNETEKVNLIDILEVIKNNRNVKNCKLTYSNGMMVLHLEYYNKTCLTDAGALNEIIENIKNNLPVKYWPDLVNVTESLPRTRVGKVDYNVLEEIGTQLAEEYQGCEKLTVIEKPKTLSLKRK